MRLFVSIKKMTFEDNIEHYIINGISNEEFYGYDEIIELDENGKFIKDTFRTIYKKDKDGNDTDEIENEYFIIKEQATWWNFPLYEVIDGEIANFDYTKYSYFKDDTDRRNILAEKIKNLYNPSSEAKLHRKTLKTILDHLEITDEGFEKYNSKVEEVIRKNPKK